MLGAPGLGSAEPDDEQSGHNHGSYPYSKYRIRNESVNLK